MQRFLLTIVMGAALLLAPWAWSKPKPRPKAPSNPKPPATQPMAGEPGESATPPAVTPAPATESTLARTATPASPQDTLASLSRELDRVLAPSGVMVASFEQSPRDVLVDLASRAGALARQSQPLQAQLQAGNLEMRAYNALAQSAQQADRPGEAGLRVAQLRSSAQHVQQLPAADASDIGAFWLLQADLIDINRNHADLASRQAHTLDRLRAFLDAHGQSDMATPVKVAMLRVALQAGQSDTVSALWLELRRALGRDDPRRVYLKQARAMLDLLGEPITLNLTTTTGDAWSLAQQRGRPVILHVYAPSDSSSRALAQPIDTLYQAMGPGRLSVLSLAVNHAGADGQAFAWPTVQLADDNPVWTTLGASALPWLVVVDADGKVAGVGQTQAVLEQVKPLAPPQAAPATQPGQPKANKVLK